MGSFMESLKSVILPKRIVAFYEKTSLQPAGMFDLNVSGLSHSAYCG